MTLLYGYSHRKAGDRHTAVNFDAEEEVATDLDGMKDICSGQTEKNGSDDGKRSMQRSENSQYVISSSFQTYIF